MQTPLPPPPHSFAGYRKHWAHRFGVAPVLPTTRAEMDALGWDACDVVLVTGDAYVARVGDEGTGPRAEVDRG